MHVFAFWKGVFDGIPPVVFVILGFVLIFVDFSVALWRGKGRAFVALALFTGGVCFLPAVLSENFSDADTAAYGILLVVEAAFFYLCLLVILSRKEKKLARKKDRAAESRQAMFILPDRENTFVRDRLNTSLRTEAKESETEETAGEYDLDESRLRLNHVRDMLAKLKAAPLSPGDRLEAEGISRLITMYATKNLLTAKEVRELNDCLSLVLKMTAKYAL